MKPYSLSPQAAVAALIQEYEAATAALSLALQTYIKTRTPPSADERITFCYPELVVTYEALGLQPTIARAYAIFQAPGV